MSSVTPSTALTTRRDREKSNPPARGKCTLRSRMEIKGLASLSDIFLFRLCVHFVREMTQRIVLVRQLDERGELSAADILSSFTSRCERTARGQVGKIRRQAGNLIELSLLCGRIRHRPQQPVRVWIARPFKQLTGWRL